jgi:uncharacterized caspase-like protein
MQRLKSQTQHALVIGINHYKAAKLLNLAGAVNDATLLKKALRQAGVNAIKPVPLCRGIKLHNQADR